MTRTEIAAHLRRFFRFRRLPAPAARPMTRAEIVNIFTILRRVRQATCGECWAHPGRRCRATEWREDLGHRVITARIMGGVHASRVFRAHEKGLLLIDLAPARITAVVRSRERLGMSVPAERISA